MTWDGWESNETAAQRDKRALSYLKLFGPDTYGISIPHELALYMEQRGWIEWMPPKFGATLYAITDAGSAKVAADALLGIGVHDWFTPDSIAYECCRKCGVVRRRDNQNNPCRGRVVLSLRDEYTEGAP